MVGIHENAWNPRNKINPTIRTSTTHPVANCVLPINLTIPFFWPATVTPSPIWEKRERPHISQFTTSVPIHHEKIKGYQKPNRMISPMSLMVLMWSSYDENFTSRDKNFIPRRWNALRVSLWMKTVSATKKRTYNTQLYRLYMIPVRVFVT